jgi:hypothetical protein
MKKIILLLAYCFSMLPISIYAQNRIAIQHNGLSSFFTSLETAYNAAVDGDTIHLPGGSFNFPNNTLAKRLMIIGTGNKLDSAKATGVSSIGQLKIHNAASESTITGVYLGTVTIDSVIQNKVVSGISFIRCYILNFTFQNNSDGSNKATRFLIQECLFSGVNNPLATNFLIVNNISSGSVNVSQSEVSNNVLAEARGENSIFKNNIFRSAVIMNTLNNWGVGIYYNNYNCTVNGVFQPYAQGAGNYGNPTISYNNLFVNIGQEDYHLTATAAQSYLGTDGTQVGVYGGRTPWKDGSLPFNPHISTFNADAQTDNVGRLRIRATINAQRN